MTTTTTPTAEQLDVMRRALTYVIEHPDEWNQETWGVRSACGTAYCLAGHVAVTIAGAQPVWGQRADLAGHLIGVHPAENPSRYYDVAGYAGERLGINADQEDVLFEAGNSLRRLAELCYLYSGGAVDLLDRLPAPTSRDVARESLAADEALNEFSETRSGFGRYRYDVGNLRGAELIAALRADYPDYPGGTP